jgi:hypothetical protein
MRLGRGRDCIAMMKLERVRAARAALERRPIVADLAPAAGVALVGLFITLVLVVPNATFPPPQRR